ncbi:MAG TPA: type II toxin-antitoxin system HigB family toxin [Anaerolineales bacterium]|nr:type II toxin-antitoxin system HigB family toxin [Anaerolineales bacterium]
MRVLSRKSLRQFWDKHPDAREPLQAWYADVKHANWKRPSDIKATYQTASFTSNNRIVFNIKGNKYRIIVVVEYRFGMVFIRLIGTHQEYDRINAETI